MPTVPERKVVKFEETVLVITTPKAWSDHYKIKSGAQLRLVQDGILTVHRPEAGRS